MPIRGSHIKKICTLLLAIFFSALGKPVFAQTQEEEPNPYDTTNFKGRIIYANQTGINDTITSYAVVYGADTIEAKTLSYVIVLGKYAPGQYSSARAQYNRLRNAV